MWICLDYVLSIVITLLSNNALLEGLNANVSIVLNCDLCPFVVPKFTVSRSITEIFGPWIFPWKSVLHGH